jgi:hypothetical protein
MLHAPCETTGAPPAWAAVMSAVSPLVCAAVARAPAASSSAA